MVHLVQTLLTWESFKKSLKIQGGPPITWVIYAVIMYEFHLFLGYVLEESQGEFKFLQDQYTYIKWKDVGIGQGVPIHCS